MRGVNVMQCRIIDYISRIGKARGFGIQSPWAYSFVTDVLMERLPYYGYERIDREYATEYERKREKLLHRLRNYCHYGDVLIIDITTFGRHALPALCRRVTHADVLVVENIYESEDAYEKWVALRDSDAIGITFDLRSMAVCFARDNKYKQHYKLNF